MDRYYYANEQNQPVGPFSVRALWELREQGLISDVTYVCLEDGSDWVPLAKLARPPKPIPPGSTSPSSSASAVPPLPKKPKIEARTSYQKTAETVGMIPDFSGKRNLLQLAIILVFVGLFALFGLLTGGTLGALGWGAVGLLPGVLVSGTVLMVLGWKKEK